MDGHKVLQINVRADEGGAAQVAQALAAGMRTFGYESSLAYGYGPHGGRAVRPASQGAPRITPLPVAAVNKATHDLVGRESRWFPKKALTHLERLLDEADLVHLHVVHSYMIDFSKLVKALSDAGKPVIWTLHDQWVMTGRCAQPGTCTRWSVGCGSCPNLGAYPPARLDFTSAGFDHRRSALRSLEAATRVRYIACAEWLGHEARRAGLADVGVIRNSVDAELWRLAASLPPRRRSGSGRRRVVFVCRDLRDEAKVRWDILTAVAGREEVSLTIVGDNAPRRLDGVRYVAALNSREDLARVLSSQDILLFTSQVDYYPLTVAEALVLGLNVAAIESPSAGEFSRFPAVELFSGPEDVLHTLSAASQPGGDALEETLAYFAPERMLREYASEYRNLLGEAG